MTNVRVLHLSRLAAAVPSPRPGGAGASAVKGALGDGLRCPGVRSGGNLAHFS